MHPSAPATTTPQAASSPTRAAGEGECAQPSDLPFSATEVSLIPVLNDNYVFVLHGAGNGGSDDRKWWPLKFCFT